ncbi:NADH-quinone oxidoreductase subunit C [Streptomyces fragilis]|uniref:NADH-quinone oxidoreductase subunit C n=1 Tax=Streptomyces fragilis TaxID=67301 RepID=UPI000D58FEF0|nr:NADH-quinone oxidoreductase subunit C [Streptomyces fragilis]
MSDGWLPEPADALFGDGAEAHESYEVLTVDVPPGSWTEALTVARDRLGCTFFDWLSAVDEPGAGFRVCAHVVALGPVRRLLLRTTVPHDAPVLATAVEVYAGAAWHERETHEMFGVRFEGHPGLEPLLLPEGFEGHPLRKDFVLAARVAKAWPGAKEPGEPAAGADHGGPRRRQMLPPGVPDPNEWGPLKGTLPAAPARGAARAAGADRPRRTRTAAEGSASAAAPAAPSAPSADTPAAPRRSRSVSQGSASQRGEAGGAVEEPAAPAAPAGPRRARSAAGGSASQRDEAAGAAPAEEPGGPADGAHPRRAEPTGAEGPRPAGPRRARSASGGSASQRAEGETPAEESPRPPRRPRSAPRSPDAPWHHAKPAFQEPDGSTGGDDERPDDERPDDERPDDERPDDERPDDERPDERRDDERRTDDPEGGGQ